MFFDKLFKKKSSNDIEQELTKEIIENNTKDESNIYGKVITYQLKEDEETPTIIYISDFHCEILPEIGSIIWCPNKEKDLLEPYKVIRFDFIEDLNDELNKCIYIVVNTARTSDIVDAVYE